MNKFMHLNNKMLEIFRTSQLIIKANYDYIHTFSAY